MPDSFFLFFQKHPQNPAKKLIKVSQKTNFDLKNEKNYPCMPYFFFYNVSTEEHLPTKFCLQ